jgi:hypothetical protein
MMQTVSQFPSIDALANIVRLARQQLRRTRRDQLAPWLPLSIQRGTERVASPTLDWAPVEWSYLVAKPEDASTRQVAICIDHDHRFTPIHEVLSLTHGEQRRAAFQQIRAKHFADRPADDVLHFVSLRMPGSASTLLHYPSPDFLSSDDNWEMDRVCLNDEMRDSLMAAFGLLKTDLH